MRIVFLLLAILAVASMASIGIFVAEQNVVMIILSLLVMTAVMGAGFVLKGKLRKNV
ncbi:DUF5325 family protein [Exiguobacterium flavidum]|uniref:DUF5325 family protein n=1 Tax=Exiguobacterium flavidum TaxID=2184695 RepID=UPI00130018AA|nr:DUF5325 family protein [Exiguobacterium flavidum]